MQTDDSIVLVHTGQSQDNESVESIVTYEVKFLFHNQFKEAIFYPQL